MITEEMLEKWMPVFLGVGIVAILFALAFVIVRWGMTIGCPS